MNDAELAERLAGADTVEAVHAVCAQIARALGCEHWLFGLRIPVPLTQPCQLILSGYPVAWRARYDEQRYMADDPVLRQAVASVLPFEWDRVARADPRASQLFGEAAEFGLRHGLTAPVHGAHGEFSLFSFASAGALAAAPAAAADLARRAQWLAAHVHDTVRRIALKPPQPRRGEPPPALTPRERECLRLAAEGETAGAIAGMLNISERTAVFHLARCQEKLSVRTRQHAVARALALGEIAPRCYPDRLVQSQRLLEGRRH